MTPNPVVVYVERPYVPSDNAIPLRILYESRHGSCLIRELFTVDPNNKIDGGDGRRTGASVIKGGLGFPYET